MRVKNGRGYVAADRNYDEDLPFGYIPVDAFTRPCARSITRSNLPVSDNDRLRKTDDRSLDNGAITPQDAIGLAAKLVEGT